MQCDENDIEFVDWDGMECEEDSAAHDEEAEMDSDMAMGLMSPGYSPTVSPSTRSGEKLSQPQMFPRCKAHPLTNMTNSTIVGEITSQM